MAAISVYAGSPTPSGQIEKLKQRLENKPPTGEDVVLVDRI
jgi:hypothetical protein